MTVNFMISTKSHSSQVTVTGSGQHGSWGLFSLVLALVQKGEGAAKVCGSGSRCPELRMPGGGPLWMKEPVFIHSSASACWKSMPGHFLLAAWAVHRQEVGQKCVGWGRSPGSPPFHHHSLL